MTFQPKPITTEGIPTALQKAERYRVINDPTSAESICLDVLAISPENQQALVTLILAITDQFGEAPTEGLRRAQAVLPRLQDEYKRAYYAGIICERCAKAQLRTGLPRAGEMAYDWLQQAMTWYQKAELQRPPGNDEAILRWNTCGRLLERNPHIRPAVEEPVPLSLE
ncbi:MAG TPA: hypothetical protein VFS51_12150 [Gemmatimonadales bacterium]|nr:hypothetical protein [Gemmatimonadales bacterium]